SFVPGTGIELSSSQASCCRLLRIRSASSVRTDSTRPLGSMSMMRAIAGVSRNKRAPCLRRCRCRPVLRLLLLGLLLRLAQQDRRLLLDLLPDFADVGQHLAGLLLESPELVHDIRQLVEGGRQLALLRLDLLD